MKSNGNFLGDRVKMSSVSELVSSSNPSVHNRAPLNRGVVLCMHTSVEMNHIL